MFFRELIKKREKTTIALAGFVVSLIGKELVHEGNNPFINLL